MTISSSSPLDETAIRQVLLAAASAARLHTLGKFRTHLAVDNKLAAGFDPVTEADRDAETAIRAVIADAFPDHSIVGEEWDDKLTSSDHAWIIDPIDGTRAFISGVPVWGTLVGLTVGGRARAGLMAQPFTGESWVAIGGQTQYCRGDATIPAATSRITRLAEARASTTSPDIFPAAEFSAWTAVRERVLQVRYGLDCYAYCLLASGHIDLIVEAGLKDVDIAPLIPIIEGAGGVVSTWNGERAERGGNVVAAASPELHAEALAVLGEAMLG